MPNSMSEQLQQDMECEGLFECFHGLKELDTECFQVLVNAGEPLTIDKIAEGVERERSTAYRAVQRLLQTGLIQKEQINYDNGGYYHVYSPTDSVEITRDMQRMLNKWYAETSQLIQVFETKYKQTSETTPDNI